MLGAIRCGTVSPDAQWVALGFTSGVVSVLDTRTGMLLASFKAHEGEILQVITPLLTSSQIHYLLKHHTSVIMSR